MKGNSFIQARLKLVLYLAAPVCFFALDEGGVRLSPEFDPESETKLSEVSG